MQIQNACMNNAASGPKWVWSLHHIHTHMTQFTTSCAADEMRSDWILQLLENVIN